MLINDFIAPVLLKHHAHVTTTAEFARHDLLAIEQPCELSSVHEAIAIRDPCTTKLAMPLNVH